MPVVFTDPEGWARAAAGTKPRLAISLAAQMASIGIIAWDLGRGVGSLVFVIGGWVPALTLFALYRVLKRLPRRPTLSADGMADAIGPTA